MLPFRQLRPVLPALIALAMAATMAPPIVRADVVDVLLAGGGQLGLQQNPDGSFPFYVNNNPSAPNILGPTGIGLARSYAVTGDPNQLATLSQAAVYFKSQQEFHTWDGVLAQALDEALGTTDNVAYLKANFYDKLANGSYSHTVLGQTYNNLNTVGYMTLLANYRTYDQGLSNLTAWDFGFGAASAHLVSSTDEALWIAATQAALDNLQTGAYDVLGLAGALYGLAVTGTEYDPLAGLAAGASNLHGIGNQLAGYQLNSGGLRYQSNQSSPGDENVQETAYTIFALDALDRLAYVANINSAAQFLYDTQLPSGGWANYSGDLENNEVTGEALWGVVTAIPEPSTWALLVAVGAAAEFFRRRKSRAKRIAA